MEQVPFFEDFKPGRRFKSRIGTTILDVGNVWFTLLTNNDNWIHLTRITRLGFNLGSPLRGLVVSGFLTLAVTAGLLVEYAGTPLGSCWGWRAWGSSAGCPQGAPYTLKQRFWRCGSQGVGRASG